MESRTYGVIGTGAIGGFYGGRLARSGREVHFLLHRDYDYVKEHGLQVDSCDGSFHLDSPHIYNNVETMPKCDVVLVGLKTTNNHLLPQLLPPLLKADTVVVLIQNGIGVEADVQQMFPETQLVAGLAFICSAKTEPGRVNHQCYGSINLGNYSCKDEGRFQSIVEDFQEAGIKAASVAYEEARWKKAVWNMPFNGMTVALNTQTDLLLKQPDTRQLIRDLMMEVVGAAQHLGVTGLTERFADKMIATTDVMTPYSPSMKLDYDFHRKMEIDYIYSRPIAIAKAAGYRMPKLEMLEAELRFLERMMRRLLLIFILLGSALSVSAQLSTNPNKFLGNITTSGQVSYGNLDFATLWNQLTPENETKWQSVEGYRRGQRDWRGADAAYRYCKSHDIPFKFHCLVWGSQYPSWMDTLSKEEQLQAVTDWMDAARERYPDVAIIDVVNEAITGHAPAPFKAALGGNGATGYDWIIKAFEMAHERWPDAILVYNDYNTFQWQKAEFIKLVQTLINAGAPVDAYGCQSHDLNDIGFNTFKAAMEEIHNALQIPMYSTEYDIDKANDDQQLQRYKEQIPYMWESDYVAGITLWGYIYGKTWVTASGIIKNGVDRPAMTWLREYMQTEKAKTATGPFYPGGYTKEASVYIKPSKLSASTDEPVTINVNARLKTKTIEKVDVYVGDQLEATLTEAPYTFDYTPTQEGNVKLKAIVTATDGSTFERPGGLTVRRGSSGIENISADRIVSTEYYTTDGRRVAKPVRGITIVRQRLNDGRLVTRKITSHTAQ